MKIVVNGIVFTVQKELADYLGVTTGELKRVLNMYKNVDDIISHCNVFDINYVAHDGTLLKNARDICKYYGILYDLFYEKYHNGTSIDEIVRPYINVRKAIDYTGYTNLYEYVKSIGGNKNDYTRLRCRLMDAKEDFVPEMLDFKGEKYNSKILYIDKVTGKIFHTKHSLCKYYHIYSTTLLNKLKSGMKIEDIIKDCNSFVFEGIHYKSKKDLCRKFGISYNALRGKMSRGKTLKEAVEELAYGKFIINGKRYKSYTEICNTFKIDYKQFVRRIYKGKSIDTIIEELKYGKYVIDGKFYKSYAAICRDYGISYNKFYSRLRTGVSIEEAVKI